MQAGQFLVSQKEGEKGHYFEARNEAFRWAERMNGDSSLGHNLKLTKVLPAAHQHTLATINGKRQHLTTEVMALGEANSCPRNHRIRLQCWVGLVIHRFPMLCPKFMASTLESRFRFAAARPPGPDC